METVIGDVIEVPKRIKCYEVVKQIGAGTFGVVVSLRDVRTKEQFAAKIVKRPEVNTERMRALERELRLPESLSCRYMVNMLDVVYFDDIICVIMELIEGKDLLKLMLESGALVGYYWKGLFRQIALAIQYLHKRGMAHRDIKLENVIIDKSFNVKVCDYGVICETKPSNLSTTMCGSIPYISPEIATGNGYCPKKADIWALGILLYSFTTGEFPWTSTNVIGTCREIMEGINDFDALSADVREIVMRCCDTNCETRATIDEVLTMVDVDAKMVEQQSTMGKLLPSLWLAKGGNGILRPVPRTVTNQLALKQFSRSSRFLATSQSPPRVVLRSKSSRLW